MSLALNCEFRLSFHVWTECWLYVCEVTTPSGWLGVFETHAISTMVTYHTKSEVYLGTVPALCGLYDDV